MRDEQLEVTKTLPDEIDHKEPVSERQYMDLVQNMFCKVEGTRHKFENVLGELAYCEAKMVALELKLELSIDKFTEVSNVRRQFLVFCNQDQIRRCRSHTEVKMLFEITSRAYKLGKK